MSKSEKSHTPCSPFVPWGPPLVQHASDSSVGRLGRTRGVLSIGYLRQTAEGSYKVFIPGRTDISSKSESQPPAERKRREKQKTNRAKKKKEKKDAHIQYTMAGGGRDGELMKFKASGGEKPPHCQRRHLQFSPISRLSGSRADWFGGVRRGGGVEGGAVGSRVWPLRETWQQTPSKLLHIRPATTGQQTTVALDWLFFFLREEIKKMPGSVGMRLDRNKQTNKPTNHLKGVGVALSPGGGSAGGAVEPPGVSLR